MTKKIKSEKFFFSVVFWADFYTDSCDTKIVGLTQFGGGVDFLSTCFKVASDLFSQIYRTGPKIVTSWNFFV